MATPKQIQELREGLRKLRDDHFSGKWDAMFKAYASSGGQLTKRDVERVVGAMGFWFASKWADGIMESLDTNHDGLISWNELKVMLGDRTAMRNFERGFLA